jgi:hypothetical protein
MPPSPDVVDYLEKDFASAINTDLIAVAKFHDGGIGGFHSVPREVFCYIDYISAIRYGENRSVNAIRFVEDYLGKMNVRYKHLRQASLWNVAHGTVHEFDPKRLKHASKKYSIRWQTNNDSGKEERACHLERFKVYGRSDTFLLNINLFQLVDDFVGGVHILLSELKTAKTKRTKFQRNYTQISRQLSVKELAKNKQRSLNLQISKAVKAQRFEVQTVRNRGEVFVVAVNQRVKLDVLSRILPVRHVQLRRNMFN